MSATKEQVDAIKLIGDLSKWIAAIESAAIAVCGGFLRGDISSTLQIGSLSMAVALFVLSIIAASGVLLSLPAAIQDIEPNDKVWDRVATIGKFSPPLRNVLGIQMFLFIAGIVAFGLGVIAVGLTV